jgi:uncharacterized damage-inducible protein DinB
LEMLFRYNWQTREDWYRWCEDVPKEELLKVRVGGVGGILHTLFHIVDVEWSWIRLMQGKSDFQENFLAYNSLAKVRELDAAFRPEVEAFVRSWDTSLDNRLFKDPQSDSVTTETWGEIVRHVIAHEIHHVGQISVWAREVGRKPISANLIRRGLTG